MTRYFKHMVEANPTMAEQFVAFVESIYEQQRYLFNVRGQRYAFYQECLQKNLDETTFFHFSLPCFVLLDDILTKFLHLLVQPCYSVDEINGCFQEVNNYQTKHISSILHQFMYATNDIYYEEVKEDFPIDEIDEMLVEGHISLRDVLTNIEELQLHFPKNFAMDESRPFRFMFHDYLYKESKWFDVNVFQPLLSTTKLTNAAMLACCAAASSFVQYFLHDCIHLYWEQMNIAYETMVCCYKGKPTECMLAKTIDFKNSLKNHKRFPPCKHVTSDHKHGVDCLKTKLQQSLFQEYIQVVSIDDFEQKVIAAKLSKFRHPQVKYCKRFSFFDECEYYDKNIEELDKVIHNVISTECIRETLKKYNINMI